MKREDIFKKDGKIDQDKLLTFVEASPLREPITPEELREFSVKVNRLPYSDFPKRLPTHGKMPLPPDEHKMIGEFESKQQLYLYIAIAYNTLMDRLDALENIVRELKTS